MNLSDSGYTCLQPFPPTPAIPSALAGWMANPSAVTHQPASAGPMGLAAPNNAGRLHETSEPTSLDSF